jgi:hypothetical protein
MKIDKVTLQAMFWGIVIISVFIIGIATHAKTKMKPESNYVTLDNPDPEF